MKRWLLTVLGLGLTASLAHAEYLMFIINVGQSTLSTPAPQGGAGMRGGIGMPPSPAPAGQMLGMGPGPGPGLGAVGIGGGAMMGMMGNQGGVPPRPVSHKPAYQLIPVCIELEQAPGLLHEAAFNAGQEQLAMVKHKWGSAYLARSTGPVVLTMFFIGSDKKGLPKTSERFKQEQAKIAKEKGGVDRTLELAEWALSHGMQDKFVEIMGKLALEEKTHPIILTYQKVKADLARRIDKAPAAPWFASLSKGHEKDEKSLHYTILHRLGPKELGDIALRVGLLEHQFRGFYYWWALRGQALPMPGERLVALIANNEDEFKHFHKGLSGETVVFDGFHTQRENVTVLALQPLGTEYTLLKTFSEQYWSQPGMSQEAMLKGRGKPQSVDQIQGTILAIGLKAMEESMERATIGHDCSRQLLYATGMLPPHVVVPEWLQYGMSSIFETPPGHPWETLGAASPIYLPLVKELKVRKMLEPTDYATLRKIVTDSYFREAHSNPRNQGAAMKAKALAWSLCYNLARKEATKVQLQAYFKELARMPPDLDLDEEVLMGCFARAFDAWDSNKKKVDDRRLETLAHNWWTDMVNLALEGEELVQKVNRLPELGDLILSNPPAHSGGH